MTGNISGVSLGPGEPELITLKALKALQEADVIYCPGTQAKSRARDILEALPIKMDRVRLFHVPMSKDRTLANQAYDVICTEIADLVATGKNVAITAEGDSGFYSSVNYMFDKLAGFHDRGSSGLYRSWSYFRAPHRETGRKTRCPTGNCHGRRTGYTPHRRPCCCRDYETITMHGRDTSFHAGKPSARVPLLRKRGNNKRVTFNRLREYFTKRLSLFFLNDYSSRQTIGIDIAYKEAQDE